MRFIPTHMGNGLAASLAGALNPGSSPRIWGTEIHLTPQLYERRFIPTHMGNGPRSKSESGRKPVHPHAYGERSYRFGLIFFLIGSSPRIWGTVLIRGMSCYVLRFIPTHMGNGNSLPSNTCCNAVHPHAYGERTIFIDCIIINFGSSPRIWGTVGFMRLILRDGRFIPTHMGNGDNKCEPCTLGPVHPHAYGERFWVG